MDHLNLRISSIFAVLAGGTLGTSAPVIAKLLRRRKLNRKAAALSSRDNVSTASLTETEAASGASASEWTFFCLKFVGTGVIMATAFIHLLAPANDSLTSETLPDVWRKYPFAFAFCMFMIFVTLGIELLMIKFHADDFPVNEPPPAHCDRPVVVDGDTISTGSLNKQEDSFNKSSVSDLNSKMSILSPQTYDDEDHRDEHEISISGQLSSLLFLEFGILFHSVFVGLTLAITASDSFKTLYAVIVFHQTFEGVGLGARIAAIEWPPKKVHIQWLLIAAFGVITPIAIAIGLTVRSRFDPESLTGLIASGVCDSLAAGILIFSSLIELVARDLLFEESLSGKQHLIGFIFMLIGSTLMALLGIWT